MGSHNPIIFPMLLFLTYVVTTLCGEIPHVKIKPYVIFHIGFCQHGVANTLCEDSHVFQCENIWVIFVRGIMVRLMTNEVASLFNVDGKRAKMAFSKLSLYHVIIGNSVS